MIITCMNDNAGRFRAVVTEMQQPQLKNRTKATRFSEILALNFNFKQASKHTHGAEETLEYLSFRLY